MKFIAKNPHLQVAAKRYKQAVTKKPYKIYSFNK